MRALRVIHFFGWFAVGAFLAAFTPASCFAQQIDSAVARAQAVRMFPELGREGSALNSRFLQLYERAREANSPVLEKGDWPIVLARQAAAELSKARPVKPKSPASAVARSGAVPPLEMKPVHFKVPILDSAEKAPSTPADGKPEYKEFTLQAQIIPDGSRSIPESIPTGDGASVWRILSEFRRAARARSLDGIKQLYVAEAWSQVIPADLSGPAQTQLLQYLALLGEAEVPVIVETDGRFIPVLDAGRGLVKSLPLKAVGNAYLLDEPTNLSPENVSALDELVAAMRRFPIEELVAK